MSNSWFSLMKENYIHGQVAPLNIRYISSFILIVLWMYVYTLRRRVTFVTSEYFNDILDTWTENLSPVFQVAVLYIRKTYFVVVDEISLYDFIYWNIVPPFQLHRILNLKRIWDENLCENKMWRWTIWISSSVHQLHLMRHLY